ncbi:hypothetical protein FIBSPDRAFT_909162 [Athelia psychrophila]|uniref:PCI domain-containing protein n=1 Tax=Athelia psychrophila TaxID=1759441 RepID=A0A166Q094_9AGAM|nr:hypothetical protein FIBSPDRAFT_909162 [Fibularhizoctonia sp. CBS 109695]
MSQPNWPQPLKDWVTNCMKQMTSYNKDEVQAELRAVIAEAHGNGTLHTIDWGGMQLRSLMPKPPSLKRKSNDSPIITSKKAKKNALKASQSAPSALDFNDQVALNRRAQRFQREHEIEKMKTSTSYGGYGGYQAVSNTSNTYGNKNSWGNDGFEDPNADPNVIDWDRYTIVGTNQEIFKDYLRLTSEPKSEQIRPFSVLQRTLDELKKRWKQKPAPTYNWMCSQFKSLRQDLTVQRIKNEFTAMVYEIHARIALETSDMVEYNQCQATLKSLYELGIPGRVEEFTAYRILMLLHGRNRSELNLYVGQLTPKQKVDPSILHALNVQRAVSMGNYHAFFRLFLDAPNMGGYIMDHFSDRERIKALIVMSKAYKSVPLPIIHKELAFQSLSEAQEFLMNHKCAFFTNPNSPDAQKTLDCKAAAAELAKILEEKYRKITIKGRV